MPTALVQVLIGIVLVMTTSAAARAETDTPFPCAGRWQGLGQNTGFPDAWTIDMVVHPPGADGSCGTIEYTNPKCGGVMEACAGAGEVKVRERYTHGLSNCAPPGELRFSCEGDRMTWAWHGWEVVRTTLRRIGPPIATAPTATTPSTATPAVPTSTPIGVPTPPMPGEPERKTSGRCGCEVVGARSTAHAGAGWLLLAFALACAVRERVRPRATLRS